MNYQDASQLYDRRDHRVVNRIHKANFRTLLNKGVSLLVKTTAAYSRNGSYGRFVV
jgi:hypothetical protein